MDETVVLIGKYITVTHSVPMYSTIAALTQIGKVLYALISLAGLINNGFS